jgi:hypothetical protein
MFLIGCNANIILNFLSVNTEILLIIFENTEELFIN